MRDDRMIDPIGHVPEVLCDSPWVQAAHRRARQRYLQRGGHEAALLADGVQLRAGNWLWPPELDADLSLAEWIRQLQARGALDPSTTTELDLSHHGLEHGEQLRPLSNLRRLTAVGASWQSLDGLGHCADLRVLLAGHDRTGWTLNILLDTSGSMTTELPLALGAIASFCRDANVDSVRLLQCDVEVTRDERMEPDQLQRVAIDGFSGSDMTPAMQRLASDIEVQAAVVLTDGCIEVPREAPPYAVLWVLTGDEPWNPGYGVTVRMP
ncbi:MAG: hypothetical protein FJ100_18050 [Deltaproteobacteria bacterium]|nr:hypothetical protein [Deltaproteobacteria bacterium]